MNFICGDSLSTMSGMEDDSVDIVFSDPPYNVKKDYGIFKDNLTPQEYRSWMEKIVEQSRRIARKGVVFYVGGKHTKLFFDLIPDAHFIPVHKKAIGAMAGNYFMQYHSMFSTVKPVKKTKDLWDDIRLPGEGFYFREPRYDHPGLTSLKLTEKVLESFTLEGDLILDPFGGVGTTAVACKNMKRDCILIELNQKYLDVAQERLGG